MLLFSTVVNLGLFRSIGQYTVYRRYLLRSSWLLTQRPPSVLTACLERENRHVQDAISLFHLHLGSTTLQLQWF